MNSTTPTGGVIVPIIRFRTNTSPKCTGSMPSAIAAGTRIGIRISIAASASMKQPTISSRMLTISRNTSGLSMLVDQPGADGLRDAADRQAPAERRRRHHQRQHHAGGLDGVDDDPRQLREDRSRDRRTGRGTARRSAATPAASVGVKMPRDHAAEQDHRRHQRPVRPLVGRPRARASPGTDGAAGSGAARPRAP